MSDSQSTVPVRYFFLCILGVAGLAPAVIWGVVSHALLLGLAVGSPFALLLAWAGYRLVHG